MYVIMTEAGCTEVTKASNTREQVYCFTDENYLSECVVTALFTTILFTIMLLNKQLFRPKILWKCAVDKCAVDKDAAGGSWKVKMKI